MRATALEFYDFDSFREHLRGWDTDPVQLGPGPLRLRWQELRVGDLGIAGLDVNRRLADVSAVEPGRLGFSIALRPYVWCGQEVPPGSLVVLAPGRDYRSSLGDHFRSLEVEAGEELLLEAGLLARAIDPRDFPPERCVVRLGRNALAEVHDLAARLERLAGAAVPAARAESIRARALQLLARALHASPVPGASRVPRYGLALRALRLIDAAPGPRPSVAALGAALGVTPRAVQYAFESTLGVTPARYILSRRLARARQDLLAGGAQTVTEAASRQGFENLSRFARQYRRLFGELPSAALGGRRPAKVFIRHPRRRRRTAASRAEPGRP